MLGERSAMVLEEVLPSDATVQTLQGHDDWVTSVAVRPDGTLIASGSGDFTVHLFNADSGSAERVIDCDAGVTSLAWSPDFARLVCGLQDSSVRIFDMGGGGGAEGGAPREVARLEHPMPVTCVLWSPDGTTVMSSSGNEVFLWDAGTHALRHKLERLRERANTIAFSADGRYLAVACDDQAVHVFGMRDRAYEHVMRGHGDAVEALAWHPLGKLIATGSRDAVLRVFEKDSGKIHLSLEGHSDWITAVAYSPNGRVLASAAFQTDRSVKIWDAEAGHLLRSYDAHDGGITSLAFMPDGDRIVTGGCDALVKVWRAQYDPADLEVARFLGGHDDGVRSIAVSPSGALLASGADDNTIRLWDTNSGELVRSLDGFHGWLTCVAWSPDGLCLASASGDGVVRVHQASTARLVCELRGHEDWVNAVAWNRDGTMLASAGFELDKTVRLWGLGAADGDDAGGDGTVATASGRAGGSAARLVLRGHTDRINSVCFGPDNLVLSGSDDKTCRVWNGRTGTQLQVVTEDMAVKCVAWSPDSTLYAAATGPFVSVYTAADAKRTLRLEGHRRAVLSLAWRHDSKQLASSSEDKTVRIWHATASRFHKEQPGFSLDSAVHCVDWHPDQGLTCACDSGRLVHLGIVESEGEERPPLKWQKSFRQKAMQRRPSVLRRKPSRRAILAAPIKEEEQPRRPSAVEEVEGPAAADGADTAAEGTGGAAGAAPEPAGQGEGGDAATATGAAGETGEAGSTPPSPSKSSFSRQTSRACTIL